MTSIQARRKPPPQGGEPDQALLDAAHNAVAAGSLAYQLERERFRYVVTLAARHGLPVDQIAAAGGITCDQVATLINQGEL